MDSSEDTLPENRIRSSAAKFLCGFAVLITACAILTVLDTRRESERVESRPITAAGDPGIASSDDLVRGPDGQPMPLGFFGGRALLPADTDTFTRQNHEMRAVGTLDGSRGTLYAFDADGTESLAVKLRETSTPGTGLFRPVHPATK